MQEKTNVGTTTRSTRPLRKYLSVSGRTHEKVARLAKKKRLMMETMSDELVLAAIKALAVSQIDVTGRVLLPHRELTSEYWGCG